VLPASVLIICPDSMGLVSMTGALSEDFSVLPAHDSDEAQRLIEKYGPCRLAYCEVRGDIASELAWTQELRKAGMQVIAMVRPPCPEEVRKAAANGSIDGYCLLPMSPDALRTKTRKALGMPSPRPRCHSMSAYRILTREEVDFLLGRSQPEAVSNFR